MHKKTKVLVVGTTPDYIDWIRKTCPGRALFVTDPLIRNRAEEERPGKEEEILCDPNDLDRIRIALCNHMETWGQEITGVACFDCEAMEVASRIAADLYLESPGVSGIRNSRDKYVSKTLWRQSGVCCPEAIPVNSAADVGRFLAKTGNGLVLKPLAGSGSELVFRCRTSEECDQAFKTIRTGLAERSSKPLFKKHSSPEHLMLAEELIDGIEFSCDFLMGNDAVTIIRLTRKIKAADGPFGTVTGYVVQPSLPPGTDRPRFERMLFQGAKALGIRRGICMVDFIIRNNHPVLIEMTPRPGGDCLPFLLLEAGNLDIIRLALDVAENKPLPLNGADGFTPHMGIRIFARKNGILKRIDTDRLRSVPEVKQIHLIRQPGHVITLPPRDYDSWLLGHVIIRTDRDKDPEDQCRRITKLVSMEIE